VRILVTTTPGLGHVLPVVPLARACVAQGHEVRWATGTNARAPIEAAGIEHVAAGLTAEERRANYTATYPEWLELAPADTPQFMFPRLFGPVALQDMLPDLLAIAEDFEPDLIVHETAEFAAVIVARMRGLPHVTHGFGARLAPERLPATMELIAPHWEGAGLEPRRDCGVYDFMYLDIYPAMLRPPHDLELDCRQAIRPVTIEEATGELPSVVTAPDDRPLVYVTFGTVWNVPSPAFRAAVDALRELDVRALVTVGPAGDPDLFGTLPDRVAVARYVPQHAVLDRCAAVVSHAGSGTFLASLGRGIPQVCLPQGADQFINAGSCARVGAGYTLLPDAATPDAIAEALADVLGDPRFAGSASQVGADIARMPSPGEVAGLLTTQFAPAE
jgi:UDP:flavonoid glycosyltransferase YjiC (YdhE family)